MIFVTPRITENPNLCNQHWNLRQYFFTQSVRWSCETERVKWWMQHDRTLKRALSPTRRRKHCMGDCEGPLLDYLDIILSPWPMHPLSFSCASAPFVSLGMRFLLREEGYNVIRKTLIKVISNLLGANAVLNPIVELKKSGLDFKLLQNQSKFYFQKEL
jgi:hypothetical protein